MPPNKAIQKSRNIDPRPPHLRDSPRLLGASVGWRAVELDVDETSVECLSASVDARLRSAIQRKCPMVIRHQHIAQTKQALRDSWVQFVTQDTEKYQVNEGAKTDRADGASVHSPGLAELKQIWYEPRRMEVGLEKREHGQVNPVVTWARQQANSIPAVSVVARLRRHLRGLLTGISGPKAEILEPAFVAGAVQPGGGPLHFDDYDNLALIVVGSKTFYIAPPATFYDAPRIGEENERRGVSPHDRLTSEVAQWQVARLLAGDILYLPKRWWHYVDSTPHTVMTNVWARREET